MGTTNITKFAGGATAQVQSDAGYTAQNGPATVGFVDGPADPTQVNKAFRQSSAVAAAVARFVTDPAYGNQGTFNDSEDTATLASKISTAILSVPATLGIYKYVELFKFFLQNASVNDFADKFADDAIHFSTFDYRRSLSANELSKTILTPKGILANPPIPTFKSLIGTVNNTNCTTPWNEVIQIGYRQLSNGVIEVRFMVYTENFAVKAPGWLYLGQVPEDFEPPNIVEARFESAWCEDAPQIKETLGHIPNAILGVDTKGNVYLYPESVPKSLRPSVDMTKPRPDAQNIGWRVGGVTANTGTGSSAGMGNVFRTWLHPGWFNLPTDASPSRVVYMVSLMYMPAHRSL